MCLKFIQFSWAYPKKSDDGYRTVIVQHRQHSQIWQYMTQPRTCSTGPGDQTGSLFRGQAKSHQNIFFGAIAKGCFS
jgi:hypothetical protein